MRLRYAGTCRICQITIPPGTEAVYERPTRTVRCLDHISTRATTSQVGDSEAGPSDADILEIGTPGASARREGERRQQNRRDRVRSNHPRFGGLILALSDDPQSTKSWTIGATGEEQLGARLNEFSGATLRVLHDRRIPRTRANIDHIAVTPTGIWVIDAKRYKGRPSLKIEGGILRSRTEKLMVGSRDCTKLVDGVLKQVEVIEENLEPGGRFEGNGRRWGCVPVHGVICFVEADWPIIGGAFSTRDVDVVWPKRLYPKLQKGGPLDAATISEIHRRLASTLPPA